MTGVKADKRNLLLIFILLFISGNNVANLLGTASTIVALVLVFVVIRFNMGIIGSFFTQYWKVFAVVGSIFLLQNWILGFVSWPGALNFLTKVLVGGLIVYTLGEQFSAYFMRAMYWLCLISLIGFILFNLLEIPLPGISFDNGEQGTVSWIFFSLSHVHLAQNQGMFWEPGAYAGVITLCLALNFDQLEYYYKKEKFKLFIILVALLSTKSTTGYFSVFVIMGFYMLSKTRPIVAILLCSALVGSGLFIYKSVDFLNEKVDSQFQDALTTDNGEFSNTRFGSIIFDWHYIQKHPVIGNGLHEKTRYADNPELILMAAAGENLGNGNGFSSFLASMGLVCTLGYLMLIFLATNRVSTSFAILLIIIVIMNLQGEPWMNYPLYLSLAFLRFAANPLRYRNTETSGLVSDFNLSPSKL